jgi:hypothetical protein
MILSLQDNDQESQKGHHRDTGMNEHACCREALAAQVSGEQDKPAQGRDNEQGDRNQQDTAPAGTDYSADQDHQGQGCDSPVNERQGQGQVLAAQMLSSQNQSAKGCYGKQDQSGYDHGFNLPAVIKPWYAIYKLKVKL